MTPEMRRAAFIISAIAVISSTAAIWFFVERETARESYRELERTLGLENSFLKRTLTEITGERDRFKEQVFQLSQEVIQIKQENLQIVANLNTTKQIEEELRGKIAAFEGQREIWKAQIADQRKRIAQLQSKMLATSPAQFADRMKMASLEKELARIKEEREDLHQKLSRADQAIWQLRGASRPLQEAKTAVELPPIVIGADSPLLNVLPPSLNRVSPAPGITVSSQNLSGKILTVNDEHQFVIIGLGEKDGVKPGMSFKVSRGGEQVGLIEVIEARQNISAADIQEIRTARFQSDDLVFLSQR